MTGGTSPLLIDVSLSSSLPTDSSCKRLWLRQRQMGGELQIRCLWCSGEANLAARAPWINDGMALGNDGSGVAGHRREISGTRVAWIRQPRVL